MGAPIPQSARRPARQGGSNAPELPEPGFLEQIGAAVRVNADETDDAREGRIREGYRGIADALEERGIARDTLRRPAPWYTLDPGLFGGELLDYDKVFEAGRSAGIISDQDRDGYERGVISRQGGRAADKATLGRGGGVSGFAAQAVGGLVVATGGNVLGPVTTMIGGGGTTLLGVAAREAAVNTLLEGIILPQRAEGRAALGEPMTAGEAAMDLAGAAVGGAVIGGGLYGAVKGIGAAAPKVDAAIGAGRGRFEQAVADNWERLPAGLRRRWEARAALPEHEQGELLADVAEAAIGTERLSGGERDAIDVLRRESALERGNPFVPNGAAAELHPAMLGETLDRILRENPAVAPLVPPLAKTPAAPGPLRAPEPGSPIMGNADASARFMARVRRAESSGNDAAVPRDPRTGRRLSSAVGRYQFTAGTWLAYYKRRFGSQGLSDGAILAKRGDGAMQDALMRDLTADNAAFLRRQGEAVSEGNLYVVHFAGQGGARKLFEADPSRPIEQVWPAEVIRANGFLRGKSAGEVIAWAHGKMGGPVPRRAGAGVTVRDDPAGLAANEETRAILQQALDDAVARADALAEAQRAAGAGEPGIGGALDDIEPVPVRIDDEPLPAGQDERAVASANEAPQIIPENIPEPAPPAIPEPAMARLREIADDRTRSLNQTAKLADELGVGERELRAGLTQLVREGQLTMNRKRGNFMRKPPRADGDELLEFIGARGGLRDDEGHNLGLRGLSAREKRELVPAAKRSIQRRRGRTGSRDWQRMTRSHGWLLRHEGRSVDAIGEALWERGWFTERPTPAQVLDLVEQRIQSGKPMFPPGYEPAATGRDAADDEAIAALVEEARAHPWNRELADEPDFDDLLHRSALLRLDQPELDANAAFERAILQKAEQNRRELVEATEDDWYEVADEDPFSFFDGTDAAGGAGARGDGPEGDAGPARAGGAERAAAGDDPAAQGERLADLPPETRAAFLDPDGAAVKAQADSLEHDARLLAESEELGDPELARMLADLDGEAADIETIRGCL